MSLRLIHVQANIFPACRDLIWSFISEYKKIPACFTLGFFLSNFLEIIKSSRTFLGHAAFRLLTYSSMFPPESLWRKPTGQDAKRIILSAKKNLRNLL